MAGAAGKKHVSLYARCNTARARKWQRRGARDRRVGSPSAHASAGVCTALRDVISLGVALLEPRHAAVGGTRRRKPEKSSAISPLQSKLVGRVSLRHREARPDER
eukprot:6981919-Prymnesium_polylepis.1